MNDRGPNFPGGGGARYGFDKGRVALVVGVLVIVLGVAGFIFTWFFCRIEPPSGYCAVLIKKDGKDILADDIIATSLDQKGIQLEPLSEGRYFYDPVFWDWKIEPLTQIKDGEVGVKVRQFGAQPPAGRFVVSEKDADGKMYRGIIDEPLRPGTYRVNPYAYRVEKRPAVKVEPGEVGVVTLKYGKSPAEANTFLVNEGEQGVQITPLRPGTTPVNSGECFMCGHIGHMG